MTVNVCTALVRLALTDVEGLGDMRVKHSAMDSSGQLLFGREKLTVALRVHRGGECLITMPDGSTMRFAVSEMTLVARPRLEENGEAVLYRYEAPADAPTLVSEVREIQ